MFDGYQTGNVKFTADADWFKFTAENDETFVEVEGEIPNSHMIFTFITGYSKNGTGSVCVLMPNTQQSIQSKNIQKMLEPWQHSFQFHSMER